MMVLRMRDMLYENPLDHFLSLLFDLLIFFVKSIYYTLETIALTLTPYRFRKLKDVSGQVVLITGGGGGVGRQLALNFARLRARVVIWDINKDALQGTVDALEAEGYRCRAYLVDISERERVYEAAKKVKQEVGNVEVLINNAGIVACRTLWDLTDKAIESTYAVNILSHYWTSRAFLPEMMNANSGHIVTVGSVAGLLGTYGCTDYSATKFACVGFHEALFTELKTHGYDNIHMTLVCPYYINTGMFAGCKPRLLPMLEPKHVADSMVRSILKNEVNCTLPDHVRMFLPLKCLLPAKMCWELMYRVMKGPETMMGFRGRGKATAG
ncbi:short-chain dehydrogenase/reductase family 16C member 6 [Anopheles maculipalpis]|uniref:short-chain dehydrogenase/reductase family 16C member 6 n=1 Tax=Anopheles maculipalpis TaxID=1496333 RepID=UPI0021595372|nr:short-chain dehydrogenase/reductase family 16C member 6 [Anopheles maculipalpis]